LAAVRPSLLELGTRHETDKANPNRRLLSIYDAHLSPLRDSPVTLLEIGVLGGGSLRTWRDYFRNGRIHGVDIDSDAARHAGERIRVHIGSQSDLRFLDSVVAQTGPLDIAIDDGSHLARDQVGSLLHLWPHVKPGGFYIVEDTHTSYMSGYKMGWRQPGTTMEFLKDVADDVQAGWHDCPVLIRDCESITFYRETCLLRKLG
jgi:cephalosporin hydroxylase